MRWAEQEHAGFTEVLTAWSWWDAPREGVVRIAGLPHRFRSDFDEELDDYPAEYRLWQISEAELAADLTLWETWVDWRRRFDRGEDPPPYESPAAGRPAEPPEVAIRLAVPEWRLDRDSSFADRPPRHLVRFVFLGSGSAAPEDEDRPDRAER